MSEQYAHTEKHQIGQLLYCVFQLLYKGNKNITYCIGKDTGIITH